MLSWSAGSTSTQTEVHKVLSRHRCRVIHLRRPKEMTPVLSDLCMGLVTTAILLSPQTLFPARMGLSREQKKYRNKSTCRWLFGTSVRTGVGPTRAFLGLLLAFTWLLLSVSVRAESRPPRAL